MQKIQITYTTNSYLNHMDKAVLTKRAWNPKSFSAGAKPQNLNYSIRKKRNYTLIVNEWTGIAFLFFFDKCKKTIRLFSSII